MRYLLLFTLLLCAGTGVLKAQEKSTFLKAISYYEEQLDIKFSYDPSLVELVSGSFETPESLNEFKSLAESALPIQILKITEGFYTISVTPSIYTLSLTDSIEASIIEPPFFILINSNPIDMQLNNGRTQFEYKPSLSDTIIAYAPGYEKRLIPIDQLINQKKLSVRLMTQTYLLNDVLIEDYITKGINMDPVNQSITISVKDLPLLPGETDGDIFASLAALPGITTPDGRPGNLFIRGNSVDQSMILFDNIPIYHRGHYFGTISPYNPKMVDNVEVYRSGYHPRMGGRVGGAVFVNSDTQVSDQALYGLGLNTLYGMGYGKTPLVDNKLGLVFGARHSYPTSFRSPKLKAISKSVFSATGLEGPQGELINDPEVLFRDFHAKLIYKPRQNHQISISGIYSNTNLTYTASQVVQSGEEERIDYENYGLNTEWKYQLNSEWEASLINTLSQYTYNNITQTSVQEFFAINQLKDYNSRLELSKSSSQNHNLQFGLDYKWQSSETNYRNRLPAVGGMSSETILDISNTTEAHTLSPFTNLEWMASNRLFLQLGLRGSYYSPKSSFQWSPRLSANFDVNSLVQVKAAAGLYHQYLSQVKNLEFGGGGFDNELWMLAGDINGNVISGVQYMCGVLLNKNDWLLDIEGYYKTANGITYYENRRFTEQSTYFTADDLIYGLDVYFKREVGKNGSAWVGYSYSNSKIKLDTTDQITYKSKFIQPHVTYLGYAYNRGRWKFSTVLKYGSGLNAKSLDIAFAEVIFQRAQANREPGAPPAPNPFVDVPERYPSIYSMDLSASYKIPKTENRKWSVSFGLSVINVFNQENLIDRAFRGNPPPPRFVDRRALGFAPNLMMIVEW